MGCTSVLNQQWPVICASSVSNSKDCQANCLMCAVLMQAPGCQSGQLCKRSGHWHRSALALCMYAAHLLLALSLCGAKALGMLIMVWMNSSPILGCCLWPMAPGAHPSRHTQRHPYTHTPMGIKHRHIYSIPMRTKLPQEHTLGTKHPHKHSYENKPLTQTHSHGNKAPTQTLLMEQTTYTYTLPWEQNTHTNTFTE